MHLEAEADLGAAGVEGEEVDAGAGATAAEEEVGVVAEAEVRACSGSELVSYFF